MKKRERVFEIFAKDLRGTGVSLKTSRTYWLAQYLVKTIMYEDTGIVIDVAEDFDGYKVTISSIAGKTTVTHLYDIYGFKKAFEFIGVEMGEHHEFQYTATIIIKANVLKAILRIFIKAAKKEIKKGMINDCIWSIRRVMSIIR